MQEEEKICQIFLNISNEEEEEKKITKKMKC